MNSLVLEPVRNYFTLLFDIVLFKIVGHEEVFSFHHTDAFSSFRVCI